MGSCSNKPALDNRIGFGLASKADANFWAAELGAEWYFDWGTKELSRSSKLEYWQTIRVNQDGYSPSKEKIIAITNKYRGYTWIIGNEPDNKYQDNTTPEKYAQIYHELFYLIKTNDPSAKIAIAGVSQPTPARLIYLDTVLQTYKNLYGEDMPIDWWNIHAYVLREEKDSWGADIPVGVQIDHGQLYEISHHGDLEIFQNNLINFRKWMKDNGYQQTPLVITEFGILLPGDFGFSPEFIADYLYKSSEWLINYQNEEIGYPEDENRIIQKFAWFSLSDPNFQDSNLANLNQSTLTLIGESFRLFSSINKD
ncbi:MAG: glycosyl hydrolase [Anaerolineaceae bacterium]|nr:glycosyl hydrolase [Anaerolineaceae bacterium]